MTVAPAATGRTVTNETFVVERVYPVPPSRVFAAYADRETKARWWGGGDGWEKHRSSLDFTVGGHEHDDGRHLESNVVSAYHAIYWDIVPDSRIVSTYEMHLDGVRISVSLATTELIPEEEGTRLIYTENGSYLDGHDGAESRRAGTAWLLDNLGTFLTGVA
jgi:uncharacterized protein YndB with AHSA1/START domain